MPNYKELIAWQKAMELVVQIYKATTGFPSCEQFGLTNQIRRAAVSIPSNIAEGQGRKSPNDFIRFLNIAQGSLQEVETQTLIAQRLNYLSESIVLGLTNRCEEVAKILNGLRRSLREKPQ